MESENIKFRFPLYGLAAITKQTPYVESVIVSPTYYDIIECIVCDQFRINGTNYYNLIGYSGNTGFIKAYNNISENELSEIFTPKNTLPDQGK